ncbi:MAG: PAS domain-containing protein [Bryobacterales bacterium]|nr:PAS domain-containing protein [Bryobacterales bacterium]
MTGQHAQGTKCHREFRALLQSPAFQRLMDAMVDGVLVVDAEGGMLFANATARRWLPIPDPAPPVDRWPEAFGLFSADGSTPLPPEQSPACRVLGGQLEATEELFVRNRQVPEGVWVSVRGALLEDESGNKLGALMVMHDVTEARRAQEALRRERDWAATILDTVGSLVVVLDREGRIVSFNRACEKATGYGFEEVIGRPLRDFLLPEEADEVHRLLERLCEGNFPAQHEHHLLTRAGEKRLIVWSNTCLLDSSGRVEYVICTGIDVTERRHLEAQLRQAQKMEAVGRLAGGVAHDFNNLLTIISGYAQMLAEGLPEADPLRDAAQEILAAAGRAASLAGRLLAFSRKQTGNPRLMDLNEVVAGLERMLRRVIGEDIELVTALSPDLPKIHADPVQIEQVLMNLVVNAREAMPAGGRIVIETAAVNLDEQYAQRHLGARPGPHVMLAVSDTGCGMDAEVLRQAFDPFFTTKESGTGLGLSTVYGIVQRHGGQIWAYSEPGMGATFKIYLPVARDGPVPLVEQAGAAPEAPGDGALVLVVEDEIELCKLIADVLEGAGYRVLRASNPEQALRLAAEHAGKVDLLLTDVVLPRMSGRELAARLRELRPSLPVLYMSGYADRAIVHNGLLEEQAAFLEKPFSKSVLLARVREVLKR